MGLTLSEKILKAHMVSGELTPGGELTIKIDQTLTQDATGTMVYLQFEAMGVPRVKTELSVSYVDHNTLQNDFRNMDDHRYLQSVARKYGIYFSRPGNGICHQVHLERFGVPGKTLLGSDSHTPTAGGLGMLAIGSGGLDVAAALAGEPFPLVMPGITGVRLTGKLKPMCAAKDVILTILGMETVKGGVGKIYEYCGPGVATLSVPERATITNMGAELGATSSIFPSDEVTKVFLTLQQRTVVWTELSADPDANYERVIEIDLGKIEPMAAAPHMPDKAVPVSQIAGRKINQVAIGSCTNSSINDLGVAADILATGHVHPDVSLGVSPGSRQVLLSATRAGIMEKLISAGARILESACGPCIGMGFAPCSCGISVRTFNRKRHRGRHGLSCLAGNRGRDRPVRRVHRPAHACGNQTGLLPLYGLRRLHDHRSFGERQGGRDHSRPQHQTRARGRPSRVRDTGGRAAENRGQHHHGSHYAGRGQDPAPALQHPRNRQTRV